MMEKNTMVNGKMIIGMVEARSYGSQEIIKDNFTMVIGETTFLTELEPFCTKMEKNTMVNGKTIKGMEEAR